MNENNAVYTFTLEMNQWNKFNSDMLGTDSHSAVLYKDKMIVFGGYQGGSLINETFVLDLETMK